MSDLAFRQAICSQPTDTTSRLVYADWLEDHDRPAIAEFIRVQCEIAAFDESYYLSFDNCKMCLSSAVLPIRRSAELLHAAWGDEMMSWPLLKANPIACTGWWFRRGFIERVELPAQLWLAHADALVWRPDQTVPCPTCLNRSHERNERMRLYGGFLCTTCGTHHPPGTVPRPFPPTAQPVTDVTFTTRPPEWSGRSGDIFGGTSAPIGSWRLSKWERVPGPANDWTHERWPGVTFHLPTHATVSTTTDEPGPDVPHDPTFVLGTPDAPVFETPPEPEIPLDGWAIEVRRDYFSPEGTSAMFGPAVYRGYLTRRGSIPAGLPAAACGRVFGPLVATDADGSEWAIPRAILTDVRCYMGRRDSETLLDATASGEFHRITDRTPFPAATA